MLFVPAGFPIPSHFATENTKAHHSAPSFSKPMNPKRLFSALANGQEMRRYVMALTTNLPMTPPDFRRPNVGIQMCKNQIISPWWALAIKVEDRRHPRQLISNPRADGRYRNSAPPSRRKMSSAKSSGWPVSFQS